MSEGVGHARVARTAAELAAELREPLGAIANAAHLLALSRDEFTVERVRRILARQVPVLADLADELAGVLEPDAPCRPAE
jgi:nitrogen-specific signal transduction histidine kinase